MKPEQKVKLVQIGLIILVVMVITVMLIKRFLYFHPSRDLQPATDPYRDINQGSLHARFFEGDPNKPIILFCHGNAGNLSDRSSKVSALIGLGYSVLIFDYSGYGKSKGIMSEQQCYEDASVFVALLRQDRSQKQIVMYGESMGAPVAIYVARRYNIQTVILESSLTSIKDVIKSKCGFLSFLSFLFPEFNTKSYIKGFKGRILVLHSQQDEIIPYESAVEMKEDVTKFIPMEGDHNNPYIPWSEVSKFIDQT
jgi:alpha/beta superfamily hydrolase